MKRISIFKTAGGLRRSLNGAAAVCLIFTAVIFNAAADEKALPAPVPPYNCGPFVNCVQPQDIVCPDISPIPISSLIELAGIGHDPCSPLYAEYELTADIDASASRDMYEGKGFLPIGAIPLLVPQYEGYNGLFYEGVFHGKFDGKGHTISGLYINRTDVMYVGLFSNLSSTAVVRDLNVQADTVKSPRNVGVLAGVILGAVNNVSVSGTLIATGGYAGGLAGENHGTVTNCRSEVNVKGSGLPGGSVPAHFGGLIGFNGSEGEITKASASGNVSGDHGVGGLVGSSDGTITNCYATGDVSGAQGVGGLVGSQSGYYGSEQGITYSYAAGNVSGNSLKGGLVGSVTNGAKIAFSYWDITASGMSTSMAGTGKTTAEMMTRATFTGWDFDHIWEIDEGLSYPYFRSEPSGISVPKGGHKAARVNAGALAVSVKGRTLNIKSAAAQSKAPLQIRLIDVRGRTVLSRTVSGSGAVSLSKVPAGRYIADVRRAGVRLGSTAFVVR